MRNTQDIFNVINKINQTINFPIFQAEIQKLTRLRTSLQTTPVPALAQVNPLIDKIENLISTFQKYNWTSNEESVIVDLGLGQFVSESGSKYFSSVKTQLLSNPSVAPNLVQNLINELGTPLTKSFQLYTLLQPFNIQAETSEIGNEEGIIEITFDGNVAIDDFKEARDQMNDWFLIVEGYASLLGIRREDFEIIGVSKNSPTKFKIKTALKNVTAIVTIISALFIMEKTVLESKLMIEQLKKNSLVPDSAMQKKFIEDAEKHIDEKIKEGLNSIVEKKLKEHEITDGNGNIKTSVSKGINNQYNFIINGGSVNIQVIDGKIQAERNELEKAKEDVKQIKEAYENQKLLKSGEADSTKAE